ncbi:hypothetical protein QN277_017071 [Acacia crassicarpa]|uniref:Autophagy-related protein 27 n=1 Tax=Acacia crassicarpa TaxID=499986 RepID=A0AAE1JT48_9FABA|nr:hypothetical protein QN277_017071 [Acacia crassicarpa]
MLGGPKFLKWLIPLVAILHRLASLNSASAACDFSFVDGSRIYNYTLTSPVGDFPHGVRSEDGYYKVAANETIIWFQDCGGPMRCGTDCTALVANDIGGYHVCTAIGRGPKIDVAIFDKKNPHGGVIVKMSSNGPKLNCSLSVSVLCYSKGVQGPHSLERLGTCNYATELRHPSGCAVILNGHGKGWGWFVTSIIIVLCLFGAYLLAGIVYRHFFLGIRGIDAIPNLDFWSSLPRRIQGFCASLVRKFKGHSQGYRSSYSPVNF